MTRFDDTMASVRFALVAAVLAGLGRVVAEALIGSRWHAFSVHGWPTAPGAIGAWLVLSAAYAFGATPGSGGARRSRGLLAAGITALSGIGLVALGASVPGIVIGCALAISATVGLAVDRRQGRRRPRRFGFASIVREGTLVVGSAWLAMWLGYAFGPGAAGVAAGVWGFFLVQSLRFAWTPAAAHTHEEGDGFEAACRRLSHLLDETGG